MMIATIRSVDMSSLTCKIPLPLELILPEGFPCPKCLIYANCSSPCDKLVMGHDKLTYLITDLRLCPDCGQKAVKGILYLSLSSCVKCFNCNHIFTRVWDEEGRNSVWVRDYENKS
jgi:hypothetical protein